MRTAPSLAALLLLTAAAPPTSRTAPLPEEPIPSVASLPADYPASWMLVHNFHFDAIVDGRVAVIDTQNPTLPLKGQLRAAQFANFLLSRGKREIYTAETFYSRLTRGERTDAITIWDAPA